VSQIWSRNDLRQAVDFHNDSRIDDTLLHRTVVFRPATGLGQTRPPSFVAATAELASIADAAKA